MISEDGAMTVFLLCTTVVFLICCISIGRATFSQSRLRADEYLAFFWFVVFALSVVGCSAISEKWGNGPVAAYAVILCLSSFLVGFLLHKILREREKAEVKQLANLIDLVENYRKHETSVEERCARAARDFELTRREQDTLALLIKGRTRPEIARDMYVSGNTVKTHIRNLYKKMNVSGKSELLEVMKA